MTEENKRRLKLSFPVREGRSWDINAYNTDEALSVAHRSVGQPWQTGGLAFGETVLVRNTVPPNVVDTRNFEERYAKGVGLVQKYWEESNTQTVLVNNVLVSQTQGWRLRMTITAYGQE
jgi:hypothetical protein